MTKRQSHPLSQADNQTAAGQTATSITAEPTARPASESVDPGVRVTVDDLKTLDRDSAIIRNDYVIVTAGSCYLAYVQEHKNGTVQLTIKGRR